MGGKSQQSTQQVTIPPEVLARYNAVNANAENVAQTPFQQYSSDPNAFVAPMTTAQNMGLQQTANYANAAQPGIQTAEQMTAAASGTADPSKLDQAAINQYMNPYLNDVVQQQSALMNQQFQQAQSGQMGTAIKSGAFGGDRAGIAAANLQQQEGLAYGNAMAPVLQQGYNTALQTAQDQQKLGLSAAQANLERQMRGASQYGQLATQGQSAGLAGAQAMMGAGQQQQQTQQAGLTALYNQFLQQQSYPFQTAQFLANIAEGTGSLSGQTTTTTQPASFFSDRRLKENIKRIGTAKNGLPIHSFNYKGDPEKLTRLGFMADEVEHKHPEAVGLAGGFKTVDYDRAARASGGGAVSDFDEGMGFQRGGYDAGGSPDWSQLSQQHMAMYGGDPGGADPTAAGIPGKGRKLPSGSTGQQHKLLQPAAMPKAPEGAGAQAMGAVKQAEGLYNDAKGLKGMWDKSGLAGGSSTPTTNTTPTADAKPAADAAAAAPAADAPSVSPSDAGIGTIGDDLREGFGKLLSGFADGGGVPDVVSPNAEYLQGLHEAQAAQAHANELQDQQRADMAARHIDLSPDLSPLGQAMDNQGVFHSMQTYGGPQVYVNALKAQQNAAAGWGGPYARGGLAGGFADGGAPGGDGGLDIPDDKSWQQDKAEQNSMEPKSGGSGGSGGSGIGSAVSALTGLVGLFLATGGRATG